MDFKYNQYDLNECFFEIKSKPTGIFKLLNELLDIKYYDFIQEIIYLNRDMIYFTNYLLKKSKEHKYFIQYYIDKFKIIRDLDFLNRWFLNNITFDCSNFHQSVMQKEIIPLYPILGFTDININKKQILSFAPIINKEKLGKFLNYYDYDISDIFNFFTENLKISDKFTSTLFILNNLPKEKLQSLLNYKDKKRNNIVHKIIYSWFQKKINGYKNLFKILKFIFICNPAIFTQINKREYTPMNYIFEHKKHILDLFFRNMEKEFKENSFEDELGNSLLHYVRSSAQIDILLKYNLLSGFNMLNNKNQNPLHIVSKRKLSHNEKFNTISHLISLRVSYKHKDINNERPIDFFGKAIIKRLNLKQIS
jgi:hypothetical protein